MSKGTTTVTVGYQPGEVEVQVEGLDDVIVWSPEDALEVAKLLMSAALKARTKEK